MMKIAVTGPESTGKSWLAEALATHYRGVCLPEYAREFLENIHRPYTPEDVLVIAGEQHRRLLQVIANNTLPAVVADTELLVISIWLEHKYGITDTWVDQELPRQPFDLYLLCDIDMPWVDDPLREHPHKRRELFEKYRKRLSEMEFPWYLVQGTGENRLLHALNCIEKHFFTRSC
jgi:nicotinamide riboside kinase